MKKVNVIGKNWIFQEIIKQHKQKSTKYLVIYYRNNQKHLRAGISISKKSANAVLRNKYKRQVRNILDLINFYQYKKDVVIILRKPFLTIPFIQKQEKLQKILKEVVDGK